MANTNDDPCNICLEFYNKKIKIDENESYYTGNKITCIKCDYSTCAHCTSRYLLDSKNDAHCMNCKTTWDRNFLMDNFTKQFVNKNYKKHREETLFEREKALLPATMEEIEKENKIIELTEEKERYRKKMEEELYNFDVKIWNLQHSSGKQKKERNRFIKRCTVEGCKGFLSTQWKCGICSTYTCKCCHEIIGKRNRLPDGELEELPEHTCNEDNIKTAMLIQKDCKNCPKCPAVIYKIDGCNQMWCTECHTAFDWRTGDIITGHFHNPHWYAWIRENNNGNVPREPDDIPCGGNIGFVPFSQHLQRVKNDRNVYSFNNMIYNVDYVISFLCSLHRMCNHLTHDTIRSLDATALLNDDEYIYNTNRDLRKKLLRNQITDEYFKREIQKNEKKRLKCLNFKQIYQTFITASHDMFRNIYNTNSLKNIINYSSQLILFINYINKQLENHHKVYNCVSWQFKLEKGKDLPYSRYNYNNRRRETVIRIDHTRLPSNGEQIVNNRKIFKTQ